jgi:hypothetical protein
VPASITALRPSFARTSARSAAAMTRFLPLGIANRRCGRDTQALVTWFPVGEAGWGLFSASTAIGSLGQQQGALAVGGSQHRAKLAGPHARARTSLGL